ncbi:preprotein translocase subunit SecA [Neptuniibacter sp. QD37_11]|uniref:preprotein translocase subunit SecA n=1 Tax=Neptuniibacter sp. QD37_11 TaxID=3398209 RepID=UPI0039F47011
MLKKILNRRHNRQLGVYNKLAGKAAGYAEQAGTYSDEELKAQFIAFGSEPKDAAFGLALAKEITFRATGLIAYNVQLMGAQALIDGYISEMKTGEGKTLVAAIASLIQATKGIKTHIVTVNDYLAARDAEFMKPVAEFAGYTVNCIVTETPTEGRQAAYNGHITYSTSKELSLDYLRNNVVHSVDMVVPATREFVIVDEADSVLIDDARKPMALNIDTESDLELHQQLSVWAKEFTSDVADFEDKDTKHRTDVDVLVSNTGLSVLLTDTGASKLEGLLVKANMITTPSELYTGDGLAIYHGFDKALCAQKMMKKDVDYVVLNGEVIIIDQGTGRLGYGSRWGDGLHQAVEIKEGVEVKPDTKSIGSITKQNFFRLYQKMSGMTGTAMSEAAELHSVYGLNVIQIPPNKPFVRIDHKDQIFLYEEAKLKAAVTRIAAAHKRSQPVLVGTASVEQSEIMASLLTKANVRFNVLNAKHHEAEAGIIAQAGRLGAVTIITNMAGRGTDILLGGDPEHPVDENHDVETEKSAVIAAGGLLVVGTERHESRRVDDQLRGRAGRQGDVGESVFYVSLQDEIMKKFGADKLIGLFEGLGADPSSAIEHRMANKGVADAQIRLEEENSKMRKALLSYDDVLNEQRLTFYGMRDEVFYSEAPSTDVQPWIHEGLTKIIRDYVPEDSFDEAWKLKELNEFLMSQMAIDLPVASMNACETEEALVNMVAQGIVGKLNARMQQVSNPAMANAVLSTVFLQVADAKWRQHLETLDELRNSVGWRTFVQKDPILEYKEEGFRLFKGMVEGIERDYLLAVIAGLDEAYALSKEKAA